MYFEERAVRLKIAIVPALLWPAACGGNNEEDMDPARYELSQDE